MGYAAQNLRDLLALARVLRRMAQDESHDAHSELLLQSAAALETRAFRLALGSEDGEGPRGNVIPPAPVNLVV